MRGRTNGSTAYGLWFERATTANAPPLSARDRTLVDVFIASAFGLPTHPKPDDQLQGYVAEALWHLLTRELVPAGRTLRMLDPPSWTTTEPGGDGLAIYEVDGGVLIFRLWEVKKAVGTAHISATIGHACDQLSLRGLEYLAKWTAVGSRSPDPALGVLFAELPSLWQDDAPVAGVGIAIGTSRAKAPTRGSFGSLRNKFPAKAADGRLDGLVVAVGDYAEFTNRVRDWVWSGR
jgi:hypothetical protein